MTGSFDPQAFTLDRSTLAMGGSSGSYRKYYADLSGVYQDDDALAELVASSSNRLAYRVDEFRPSETEGDLIFGISVLLPGRVGDEFALTRGHRHTKSDRAEIYFGISGTGVLLLEDPDGNIEAVPLAPDVVAYVPPHWIHRSVNTSDEPLASLFCYPADSGQDYEVVASHGGMARIVRDDGLGGWELVDNPRYRRPGQ